MTTTIDHVENMTEIGDSLARGMLGKRLFESGERMTFDGSDWMELGHYTVFVGTNERGERFAQGIKLEPQHSTGS